MEEEARRLMELVRTTSTLHSTQIESVIQQNRDMLSQMQSERDRLTSIMTLLEDRIIAPMDQSVEDLQEVTRSLQLQLVQRAAR